MNSLGNFALYNLSASLIAGLIAWGIVWVTLRLLNARTPFLYAGFLALPLLKSALVLLGIGLVFPLNSLAIWQQRAIAPGVVFPFVIIWFGLALIVYRWLVSRARADILRNTTLPANIQKFRLQASLDQIMLAYQQTPCCEAGETVCCISDRIPANPRLMISDMLYSPLALVEGGMPVIIFPTGLIDCLDDQELTLALAHELNHFALRKPVGWSAGNLRLFSLISPVALLLAEELYQEEEKACDDLAVRIMGSPDVFAGMLLKSYQFSRIDKPAYQVKHARVLPQLFSGRPFLSQRVVRLLDLKPHKPQWMQSLLITWPVWVLLLYVLFFARFGA